MRGIEIGENGQGLADRDIALHQNRHVTARINRPERVAFLITLAVVQPLAL